MKKFYILIIVLIPFKLSSQNDVQFEWATTFSTGLVASSKTIEVDQNGNVYTFGIFNGDVDFNPGTEEYILSADSLTSDYFIQKLDADGNFLWARSISRSQFSASYGAELSSNDDGGILISGSFEDTVDFDPGPDIHLMTSSPIGTSIFLLKLDINGNFSWVKTFYSNDFVGVNGLEKDTFGNILLMGRYRGSVVLNSTVDSVQASPSNISTFIFKLSNEGDLIWAKSFVNDSNITGRGISSDSYGNILVTGSFEGTVDFNDDQIGFELSSNGNKDIYIIKLDNNGNLIWANSIGGNLLEDSESISCDYLDNIILSGTFQSTISFNGIDSITPNGSNEVFIQKLSPDGNNIWGRTFGSFSTPLIYNHDIDNYGNIYTAGVAFSDIDIDPGTSTFMLESDSPALTFFQKLDENGNFIWANYLEIALYNYVYSGTPWFVNDEGQMYFTGYLTGPSSTVDLDPTESEFEYTSFLADAFVIKLNQSECANFTMQLDSLSHVGCNNGGYIGIHGVNGAEPYSYSWENTSSDSSNIFINSPGFYTMTLSDSNECERSATYIINGPTSIINYDLNVDLIESEFRPGFSSLLTLIALNSGCEEVSGQLILTYDGMINYDSSLFTPDEIIGDSLIWNFSDQQFESNDILSNLFFTTDELAVIGDSINFNVIITPIEEDADTLNNKKQYTFPIVNGYDPNNKQVYPIGVCNDRFTLLGEDLYYTIHFQNTGNSEAINIHIIDSISEYLDISSINILSSSHPMYTEIKEGNVMDFMFDNINLPDSANNETLSHGYVLFKISPLEGIASGTIIKNTSEIYFDYNPAVITNTVFNTMVAEVPECSITSIKNEFMDSALIKVFPNPTKGSFNIDIGDLENVNLKIMNLSGQIIYQDLNVIGPSVSLTIDEPSGVYLLTLLTSEISYQTKIIKY